MQAQQWVNTYLKIIEDSKGSVPELQLAWTRDSIPKYAKSDRQEAFMTELHWHHLELVLRAHRHPTAVELEQSVHEAMERIGGRPGSLVIGTNYGWQEGMKSSARETSIDNGTSLWTYLDLYDFLVRTDEWDVDERQEAFIDILAKDGGPVCWHVAQL